MSVSIDPHATIIGLVVGLLIGVTGMGGASLMTPLLILVLGVPPTIAVGTDLVFASVTKAVGVALHARQGTVDRGVAGRIAAGSIPGVVLGTLALARLAHGAHSGAADALVLRLLGVLLVVTALATLARQPRAARVLATLAHSCAPRRAAQRSARLPVATGIRWLLPFAGFVVGALVGLTSVGSGTLIFLLLSGTLRLPLPKVVGTDLLHALLLTTVAGGLQLLGGHVQYTLVAGLLIGSLPGVALGSLLCPRLPERPLRAILAAVLLISGVRLL